jgi:hypothetical protein
VPGVASQVPVSTALSGVAHASTLPIVGRSRPPTGSGIKTSNALGSKSDGRSMYQILISKRESNPPEHCASQSSVSGQRFEIASPMATW